jgi:hypothetical protein
MNILEATYTVGQNSLHYDSPIITFSCSEHQAEAFVQQVHQLTKWNFKKRRTEVRNKTRTERNGACILYSKGRKHGS